MDAILKNNRSKSNGIIAKTQFSRYRRLGCAVLVTLLLINILFPPAAAFSSRQNTGIDPILAEKLAKPGNLTLRDTTINTALFTISEIWKINIVVGEKVTGKINGVFKDAPLHEILDSILLTNGYSYRPVGKSLVVMKIEALGDTNPMFVSKTIHLKYAKVETIVNAISMVKSPKGKLEAIVSVNSLLILDYPDRVFRASELAKQLDAASSQQPGTILETENGRTLAVETFVTQYVDAKDLQQTLEAIKSKKGKISVIPIENRIVVTDFPAQIRLIKNVIQRLDVPRKQVRVTALIYDINVEDLEQLGINWSHALKDRIDAAGNAQSVWSIDSVTQTALTPGAVGGVMTFMNLSRHIDINAVIQALHNADDARLLADPSISVVDNTLAKIEIVSEIPYQQLTQTQQGGQIGTTAFRKAGVTLQVTPRIANDGTIAMKVKPSFSRLTGFTEQDNQPIIDTREAETTVRVMDGQTMVIGGLRQRTEITNLTGIPFLKDLRWIGWLFRHRKVSIRESELIVFITPEVITTDYYGNQREQAAHHVSRELLDQIPVARPHFCPPYEDSLQEDKPVFEEVRPESQQAPKRQQNQETLPLSKDSNQIPVIDLEIHTKSLQNIPYTTNSARIGPRLTRLPPVIEKIKATSSAGYVNETSIYTPAVTVQPQQSPGTFKIKSSIPKKANPRIERFPPLIKPLERKKRDDRMVDQPKYWMNDLFRRE